MSITGIWIDVTVPMSHEMAHDGGIAGTNAVWLFHPILGAGPIDVIIGRESSRSMAFFDEVPALLAHGLGIIKGVGRRLPHPLRSFMTRFMVSLAYLLEKNNGFSN